MYPNKNCKVSPSYFPSVNDEIVEFDNNIDHDKEKSISIAMDELLNNDLEFRNAQEDNEESDK